MKIVFIDGVGGNYNGASLSQKVKIGGTEVTIIRVAELLAKQHEVYVLQKNCDTPAIVNKVNYQPLIDLFTLNPDVIIGIRPRRLIFSIAKQYSHVPCYYWMHDIPSSRLWKYKRKFQKANCSIIAISNFQKTLIKNAWRGNFLQRLIDKILNITEVPIDIIYNPIANNLHPEFDINIDTNKLIFFSAPDRGLDMILENFYKVLAINPNFKLFIAHPGYAKLDKFAEKLQHPNIVVLGTLPNTEIIQHVRESLCVFYPQNIKPECFGLVYAESNAIGTPVLAHNFGAAAEVLSSQEQLIDAANIDSIRERLQQWQIHRPNISLKEIFREENVLQQWEKLLKLVAAHQAKRDVPERMCLNANRNQINDD